MGNSTIKGPKTEKVVRSGMNKILSYSSCEMQGWRNNMVEIFNLGRCCYISA
jgi:hypothetical protein